MAPPIVYGFDLPWGQKEYKNEAECLNVNPQTKWHEVFLEAVCNKLFYSQKPITTKTKAYYTCLRNRVFKTTTRASARREIFSCAESYPPMANTTPLSLATRFFPTDEELAEEREYRRRMAPPPPPRPMDCMAIGDMLHCL